MNLHVAQLRGFLAYILLLSYPSWVFAGSPPAQIEPLVSEVYQTPGTAVELATKAKVCIAQILKGNEDGGSAILADDVANGRVVARNYLTYGTIMRWQIRSRLTFEAHYGRFRIEQSGVERFFTSSLTGISGWGEINEFKRQEAFGKLVAAATAVARCIQSTNPIKDW